MGKAYIKLFANCIPVKGYKRSMICDLQRQSYKFIPNSFYNLLNDEFNINPVSLIRKEYDAAIVNEYIQFIEENEFGFWCSKEEMERFPKLSLEWDFAAKISNAIIDIKEIDHDFTKIFKELELLGCKYLQIRLYKETTFQVLNRILEKLEGSIIKSVQIVVPYTGKDLGKIANELIKLYNRISSITITASPDDRIISKKNNTQVFICFLKQEFNSCNDCGVINPKHFVPNIKLFTEAQKHNTCLNRKISVDINGEIKNCPSSAISYGNIANTSLIKAIKNNNFQKNWFISKDEIEVCKDCEFRYICIDCRVFVQDSKNQYSKPSKCNYDPYTATFKN